ncbi:MAG: methyltransferase domain-containing protein [Deltaproteobacteria bacterium]|jgi:SAM-dependent methyltransferase|nr:methyltransferase domain-containing protein [Deltaproteobacteria bacterium]
MDVSSINPFDDFFEKDTYVLLKNCLYNYVLRKRAVEKSIQAESSGLILELGSGLSPMITNTDTIVYSELSLTGLQTLKHRHGKGWYVVADAIHLPFRSDAFAHTVCSEVLEHIEEDRTALRELARVLRPSGDLFITFPHRRFYFARDDHFVKHFRRYELDEIKERIQAAGLRIFSVKKVLGPLEKMTMWCAVLFFSLLDKGKQNKPSAARRSLFFDILALCFKIANRIFAVIVWLEARIIPLPLATVLLIGAKKQ